MQFEKPSRKYNLYLLALLAFNLIPHLIEQSLVVMLFCLPCILWRLAYEYQKLALPNVWGKFVLVALGFGSLFFLFGELRSVEATTAALLIACSLKMLDNVRYRDAMVVLFVNFFVLMTGFLFSQNLAMTLFGGLDVILITSLLFQLHKGKSLRLNFWYMLKLGAKMSLAVLPLLILLFVVFPRVTTGILSNANSSASSGFSESLEPGGVDKLALDDSTAFRVKFKEGGVIPDQRDLYWRGAVFTKTKGLSWGLDRERERYKSFNRNTSGADINYEITLESAYGKWLFLLEDFESIGLAHWRMYQNLEIDSQGSLFFKKNLGQKIVYNGGANLKPGVTELSSSDRELYLQNSASVSEQIKTFLEERFPNKQPTAKEFTSTMRLYFTSQFRYALDLKGRNSQTIEEFLFNNKVGFCEHFAGSFSYLARLSGIPSRVVVGFQGGKRNPLSDFYRVSNRDAHAWSEIYDEEMKKWVRVDPTDFVAPERLLLGGQIFHNLTGNELANVKSVDDYYLSLNNQGLRGLIERAKLFIDVVEQSWNEFLLGYDFDKQKELLKSLGINVDKRSRLFVFSILLLICFFGIYRYYQIKGSKSRLSAVDKIWLEIQKTLELKEVERGFNEGPRDYLERAAKLLPESELEIRNISSMYITYKYSDQENIEIAGISSAVEDLKSQLKQQNSRK